MSICLDPTHLVTCLLINFPQRLSLVTLLICSLNFLCLHFQCWFVVVRFVSCPALSCLACLPVCFSPTGLFLFVLFIIIIIINKKPVFLQLGPRSLPFHPTWQLAYLPAIALKAAEYDADLTRILFSQNSHHLFWPTSGLKVSTNERTSWIGCLDEGQSWCASGQFLRPFQRHVLKCDAYITYCMHAHSFLVTSCLNWRHS